jgi:glycosyltransferase involved in cell wall biosynthesis
MDHVARLSVIVTAYNIEDYIDQCLQTVCGQTLADLEIIVVDDGSSDATPRIIAEYAQRDARVIPVLFEQNTVGGVATAANAGLDRATPPYVGFVDGDDYCELDMFEKLLTAAEQHDADLAMCRYMLLDSTTGELAEPADEARWIDLDEPVYDLTVEERKRFLQFVAVPWRKIYRRQMLDDHAIRFPVGDYFYEDNPFHWFSLLTARSLAVVPEVLCYHRVARVGQTMATVDERLFRIFAHHATIHRWLADHPLAPEFEASLLGWAISQLEWIAPRTPPELRRTLFAVLREVFRDYDENVVEAALDEGKKGEVGRALALSVLLDNYAGFVKTLETGQAQSHPMVSARYHLRYSDIGTTAKWASRYLSQRYDELRAERRPRQAEGGGDNTDVLFALVLLERRIEAMQTDIRGLRESLEQANAGQRESDPSTVEAPDHAGNPAQPSVVPKSRSY